MWGGRFSKGIDNAFSKLNASYAFDWRLYAADIRGSIAYAKALVRAGILSELERDTLIGGLEGVLAEFQAHAFEARPDDEDIHTAVERRLGEMVGPVAGKLHTGRSRNDQIATDVRLYLLDAIAQLQIEIRAAQQVLIDKAELNVDAIMPGYTHLQRAQPVLVAHWLMSFFWMLDRDWGRLADTAERAAVLPLGAGALAGNAIGIDREFLAQELGFHSVTANSLDAVSDRDAIAEFLFAAALIGVHLSHLGEDLVLYSSAEFGFVTMDDAYATGSSLMPQKKNPDAMELARGKSARLTGDLVTVLTLLKGLPSSYDKDLQEDKEPLFDAVDTLELLVPVVAGVVRTLRINGDRMRAALDPSLLATDLADYLVRRGMPFRQAHRRVGEAVRLAETRGVELSDLSPADYASLAPEFGPDVMEVFDFARSVASRQVTGGTAPQAVRSQIAAAREIIRRE